MAKKKGGGSKTRANDPGPAGNTASTTTRMPAEAPISRGGDGNKKTSFKSAGKVLSQSEVKSIAKAKNLTPAEVMSKALDKGIGLGSKVVNGYSQQGNSAFGNYVYNGTPDNLNPLSGLTLGKGTAYYGASQYSTPGRADRDGWHPGSTTYNPIVMPRAGTAAGQGGGGGNGGGGGGNGKTKNDGTIESIKALHQEQMDAARAEIDDYKNRTAEQIETMQLEFGNTIADITTAADARVAELSDLMLYQQQQSQSTQDLLQQQAMAAEAAYQEQARVASALGRAYVPAIEQSAATVSLGDQRTTQDEKDRNSLSELAIVSGLGTNSNPLAGLQLA